MRRSARWSPAVLSAAMIVIASAVKADTCVGDCDGDGMATADEPIVMVSVALGAATTAACDGGANQVGGIRVEDILTAVNNVVTGCHPSVEGPWLEEHLHVTGSTCSSQITQAVDMAVAMLPPCVTEVTALTAEAVRGVDCNGVSVTGELSAEGILTFHLPLEQQTMNGCTVGILADVTVDASTSPTTAHYNQKVSFAGTCPLAPCTLMIESQWTRQ